MPPTVYTSGHHPSVLRSHTWRTAANSAAFLLPHLAPTAKILDLGCGPGTITLSLSAHVPLGSILGIDMSAPVIAAARALALSSGARNVAFEVGTLEALDLADGTFDVVFAHQVLQHLGDPVGTLRRMGRLLRAGGVVAVREADFEGVRYFPENAGVTRFLRETYPAVARANGGQPDAGRRLRAWALEAGFEGGRVEAGASAWCFSTAEEVEWWSGMWADRCVKSELRAQAEGHGIVGEGEMEGYARAWREWGEEEGAWFGVLHGEVLCWK